MYSKILKILDNYGIDYALSGKNIKKGNIGLNCIFCGDDNSYHLGISPSGYYSCWRNQQHRGHISKLLVNLLNLTYTEVKELLGDKVTADEDEFLATVQSFLTDEKPKESSIQRPITLSLPEEFRKIEKGGTSGRFYNYLYNRGYTDIDTLVDKYNLRCCLVGDFSFRIILPIYDQSNKLVSWTSRTILQNNNLKYRDLEPSKSIVEAKATLFNLQHISRGGNILIVSEGPFDALKLDYYAPKDCHGSCLFTKSITIQQTIVIEQLSHLYNKIVIMLDNDAEADAINIVNELSFINNVTIGYLPKTKKDAGELNRKEIEKLYEEFI